MGSRYQDLEIVYKGSKVSSFSSSKAFLWNRGTEAIRRQDIAPAAPLCINAHAPAFVLDHKVLYCSSPHSKVHLQPQKDSILNVDFDFLNPKNGVIIEVLHTGGAGSLSMSGSIIGGGELRRKEPHGGKWEMAHAMIYMGAWAALNGLAIYLVTKMIPMTTFPLLSRVAILLVVIILAMMVFVIIMKRLGDPSSGGLAVKKLDDGYAKQQERAAIEGRRAALADGDRGPVSRG